MRARSPVSSCTSRYAVSARASPGSRRPFGKLQRRPCLISATSRWALKTTPPADCHQSPSRGVNRRRTRAASLCTTDRLRADFITSTRETLVPVLVLAGDLAAVPVQGRGERLDLGREHLAPLGRPLSAQLLEERLHPV